MYNISDEQERQMLMQIRAPKHLSEITVPGWETAIVGGIRDPHAET
jgi:hypothetical protein